MPPRSQGRSPNNFEAAYRRLPKGELARRADRARAVLSDCRLCPRKCGVDRTGGEKGFCRTLDRPVVSSWGPHYGEERPLVGSHGSGTIFFTNCNLGCIFCQNWTISHAGEGVETTPEGLARVMLGLEEGGCHNINLVTPTHQVPMILDALVIASGGGLSVPVVYNCGGYEAIETLNILDGVVDIYMPDIKYADPGPALKYSKAEDYPEAAKSAVREMHRQVGDLVMDDRGIAQRGLLVRHLVLPDGMAGTEKVVRFLAGEISKDTYLNVMDQYHPCYKAVNSPPLDRRITAGEYKSAVEAALVAGLKRIDGVTV